MLVWCVGWSKSVSSNSVAVIVGNYDQSYSRLLQVLFEIQLKPKKKYKFVELSQSDLKKLVCNVTFADFDNSDFQKKVKTLYYLNFNLWTSHIIANLQHELKSMWRNYYTFFFIRKFFIRKWASKA